MTRRAAALLLAVVAVAGVAGCKAGDPDPDATGSTPWCQQLPGAHCTP